MTARPWRTYKPNKGKLPRGVDRNDRLDIKLANGTITIGLPAKVVNWSEGTPVTEWRKRPKI